METECGSWYSLMSKRTNERSEPNKVFAKAFAKCVLPTPLEPTNKKLAETRVRPPKPTLERRNAPAKARTASG